MRATGPLLALIGLLAGCASPRIKISDPGRIAGTLMIFWVGEDRFVYYPSEDPLTYTLPRNLQARIGAPAIRPGAIYTDGGSIPPSVRGLAGFSPWGYGPAYVVHDWLFDVRHCLQVDRGGEIPYPDAVETVRRIDFPTSAAILAGVIEALVAANLVPRRGFAPDAIYGGAASFVARRSWNARDPDTCRPVGRTQLDAIEGALGRGIGAATAPGAAAEPPVLIFRQSF